MEHFGEVVDLLEMWWIIWRCCGSLEDVVLVDYLKMYVVDYLEMWWITWRCGGSLKDVMDHLEMWWHDWEFALS